MKITQGEVIDHQTVLQIELGDSDLGPYLDQGYRQLSTRVVIPGFRKGKAPRRVVENFVGRESLINEVLDSMAAEVAKRAIDEQNLDTMGPPRLELLDMDPFTLKATVPLTPEADLSFYRDIRVELPPVEVTEEDVDAQIGRMRHSEGTWDPVDRPVAMGDRVTMDADGKLEGKTVIDNKDVVYTLDSKTDALPGLAENLVGAVVDTPAEFVLSLPSDYDDTTIADKDIHLTVAVKEIKEFNLPELDDEFAKGVGDGYDNLAALRNSVLEQLKERGKELSLREHREKVVTALVDGLSVKMPAVMVERGIEHQEVERAAFLQRFDIRVDDYLQSVEKTAEEARSEIENDVVRSLRRRFALSKVAELEGIQVSDDDVDARVDALKSQQGSGDIPADAVREALLAEKTVDRLVEIARGEAPDGPATTDDESRRHPDDAEA